MFIHFCWSCVIRCASPPERLNKLTCLLFLWQTVLDMFRRDVAVVPQHPGGLSVEQIVFVNEAFQKRHWRGI